MAKRTVASCLLLPNPINIKNPITLIPNTTMITLINTLIASLTRLREQIIENRERNKFIQEHYKDIENAAEFWDKYH